MLSRFGRLFQPTNNEHSSRLKSEKSRVERLATTPNANEAGGDNASRKTDGSSLLSRMFKRRSRLDGNKAKSSDAASVPPTSFSGATIERSNEDRLLDTRVLGDCDIATASFTSTNSSDSTSCSSNSASANMSLPDSSCQRPQEPFYGSRVKDSQRVDSDEYYNDNNRQLNSISEESIKQQQQQQQDSLFTIKSSNLSKRTRKSPVKTDVDQLLTGAASQQLLRDTVHGNLEDLRLAESLNYRSVLYEFSFRIDHNPSNMRIFTDASDRRIEAIARSSETKIQLEPCHPGERVRTRLVTIQAPDLHSLEKCCRLFDDRFPHFYASGGLRGQSRRAIRRIYVDGDRMGADNF